MDEQENPHARLRSSRYGETGSVSTIVAKSYLLVVLVVFLVVFLVVVLV